MKRFTSAREAKEFLVSRIVEEAQSEGALLSEVEHKMLYFSETDWTLPDMAEVSDEFDRTYDQSEYEKKIAHLIKNAAKRARKESSEEYDAWWSAIRVLQKEDHYILVIIRGAGLKPRGDTLKLIIASAGVVILFTGLAFISDTYNLDLGRYLSRGALAIDVWVASVSAVIVYGILRITLGARRTNDLISRMLEILFRVPKRQK